MVAWARSMFDDLFLKGRVGKFPDFFPIRMSSPISSDSSDLVSNTLLFDGSCVSILTLLPCLNDASGSSQMSVRIPCTKPTSFVSTNYEPSKMSQTVASGKSFHGRTEEAAKQYLTPHASEASYIIRRFLQTRNCSAPDVGHGRFPPPRISWLLRGRAAQSILNPAPHMPHWEKWSELIL